jgi:hypothetical protein
MLMAEDHANNSITTQQMGCNCQYQVILELTSTLITAIVLATILVTTVAAKKRKQRSKSILS